MQQSYLPMPKMYINELFLMTRLSRRTGLVRIKTGLSIDLVVVIPEKCTFLEEKTKEMGLEILLNMHKNDF